MLLVFFVGKKDGSKRMVMDYHNLNDQAIKNNYPLPLITELIDNTGSKKVFTKMDLRWRFNNMRIKERDEWKGSFRFLRANSNVLWDDKFTCYISGNDK